MNPEPGDLIEDLDIDNLDGCLPTPNLDAAEKIVEEFNALRDHISYLEGVLKNQQRWKEFHHQELIRLNTENNRLKRNTTNES